MLKASKSIAVGKSGSAKRASIGASSKGSKPAKAATRAGKHYPATNPKPKPNLKPKLNPKRRPHRKLLPPPIDQGPQILPAESQIQNPGANPAAPNGMTSNSFNPQPLTPEAERLLGSVPTKVDDAPGDPIDVDGAAGQLTDADQGGGNGIAELMAQVSFETQDVQDQLEELFDWLSVKFKSDHWELSERQARMLGKPTAQLLNSLWAKLQTVLPEILGKWIDSTPGAAALLLAGGIVIGPKVAKQVAISRERRRNANRRMIVAEGTSHGAGHPSSVARPLPRADARPRPVAVPSTPKTATAGGMIWSQGGVS